MTRVLLLLATLLWLVTPPAGEQAQVRGVVQGEAGPLAGACVRWQTTATKTTTDAAGRFTLVGEGKKITAWQPGYFIAGVQPKAGQALLRLRPLPKEDHKEYLWVDPRPLAAEEGRCANCHAATYQEWQDSSHGRAARNPRFLEYYAGAAHAKNDRFDWNLLKELPHAVGACAACHAPTVEPTTPAFEDLRQATGIQTQGIHCDYCHKIADVSLEKLGLEHGRYTHRLLRPKAGQVFFGPLDDVDRGEETFAPVYTQSRYCAGCHEGTLLGAKVYTTYSEWQASPAKSKGQQCQTCHMTPTGQMTNFAPGHGGLERAPKTLASHRFPGGTLKQLRSSVQVEAISQLAKGEWTLRCELVAKDVGHRVPTGFIDRHLLLVVEAVDEKGITVAARGPVLPKAAGSGLSEPRPLGGGDPLRVQDRFLTGAAQTELVQRVAKQPGHYGGKNGLFLGRQIADEDGNSPVPFWRIAKELPDTRLEPEKPRVATWHLPAAAQRVRVRLLYRRAFIDVADAKGWPHDELLLYDRWLDRPQPRP